MYHLYIMQFFSADAALSAQKEKIFLDLVAERITDRNILVNFL